MTSAEFIYSVYDGPEESGIYVAGPYASREVAIEAADVFLRPGAYWEVRAREVRAGYEVVFTSNASVVSASSDPVAPAAHTETV